MRHNIKLLVFTLAAAVLLCQSAGIKAADADAAAEEPNFKQFDFKLFLKKRTQHDLASSWDDDKILNLYFTPKITSRSPVDVKDYKLLVFIIGQATYNKKVFSFIEIAEYPMIIPSRRKFEPKEKKLSVKYNDKSAKMGFKYHSYIMAVKDKAGNIVFVKSPKTMFNKILDTILKLKKDDRFDLKGNKVKKEVDARHRAYR